MSELRGRRDEQGRAYVGSELQIQIYVNRYPRDLLQCLLLVLPTLAAFRPHLRWVSPLESDAFASYKDVGFLKATGLEHAAGALHEFWPWGGPTWDALATVRAPGIIAEQGVILIQAKSHPPEFYGPGCQVPLSDHEHINVALNKTKRWLGIPEEIDWTGPLYDYAVRLAHLFFLREIVGIPAWFVNVCFLNDPLAPTILESWSNTLAQINSSLGLVGADTSELSSIFLEAKDREDLIKPPQHISRSYDSQPVDQP